MKYLFITDTHGRMVNPEKRKGNFYEDLTAKMEAICKIATQHNVDAVLHGGDFFDTERVSYELSDRWVDIIDSYEIPWYVIWGGHDEMNGQQSLNTSLSSVFRRSQHVKRLTHIGQKGEFTVCGFDYSYGCEFRWRDEGLYLPADCRESYDKKSFKIAIVHGMVMPTPWFPDKSHVTYEQLAAKTDFDLILIGHYHRYIGMKTVGETMFYNPGCVARKKTDEADIEPRGLIIDTVTRATEEVLIPCRPTAEVFDIAEVQAAKAEKKSLDQFFTELQSIEFRNHSLYDRVIEACEAEKVTTKVRDELITRLQTLTPKPV